MEKSTFMNEQLTDLSRWLKAICEPNRLMLLEQIIEGVHCNCELGKTLQLTPNLISHHLSVLRDARLIEAEHDPIDARYTYYSINRKAMEELITVFGNFFDLSRIQPRKLTCGPKMLDQKQISFKG